MYALRLVQPESEDRRAHRPQYTRPSFTRTHSTSQQYSGVLLLTLTPRSITSWNSVRIQFAVHSPTRLLTPPALRLSPDLRHQRVTV
jgi:hypothetical protein